MENFFLQAIADDLRTRLEGSSLGRVWQPSGGAIVLDLRAPDGRFLAIRANPAEASLFLTEDGPAALETEPSGDRAFGALVRKHLRGARLESISKEPRERVVTLAFSTFSTSGDRQAIDLAVSLAGRSANASLVTAEGTVLGTLRSLRAGNRPTLPADPRPLLTEVHPDALADLGSTPEEVAGNLAGFGATLLRELGARERSSGLRAALESLRRDLAAPVTDARLYSRWAVEPPMLVLATFPLESLADAECELFPDPHRAADERSRRVAEIQRLATTRRAVVDRIARSLKRVHRAFEALDDDLASTEGAERARELAECLLAQVKTARLVERGYEIDDYYSPGAERVVVEADRGETPAEVAERLFARHRKARRTREAVADRRGVLGRQREELAELEARARVASEPGALEAVAADLDKALGVRRVGRARAKPQQPETVRGARRFVSSDDYEILVGRSSSTNDELTFKTARPSDLWLHAADYPGSHVVVRNPGRGDLPHRTIVEAAQLAAYYSEARNDTLVDVRYTPRRFVTKPRGAAPGLVRISRFKTISVKPAASLDRAS